MRFHALRQMCPVDRWHDVEATILRILAAANARISIRVAVELVIFSCRLPRFLVRLKVKLDDKLVFALLQDVSEAFLDIPTCLFELSVAEKTTVGVQHLRILIHSLLASVLLLDILHLFSLLLHLGEIGRIVLIRPPPINRGNSISLALFLQLGFDRLVALHPLLHAVNSQVNELCITLDQ